MVKYFCDRCGKEIKGNVNETTETTEAFSYVSGKVVATWKNITHLCDECEYKDLTCGFKVGDEVITNDGRTGVISEICTCETCKQRGFYEPIVTMNDGTSEYIMISDKNNGFKSYYSIGNKVFGNLDEKSVSKEIDECKDRLLTLYAQLGIITELKSK